MQVNPQMADAAAALLAAGLCVLPARRDQKRPTVAWRQYQQRLPTGVELDAWFARGVDALCILCGRVSGNAELLDFDAGGELFDAWAAKIPPELLGNLVIQKTQNGGRHVFYRCEAQVCGNMKLAQRRKDGQVVTLIETRGEGGLFLCAPTPGYELIQGDLCAPPVLTGAERDLLLGAAWELNEYAPPVVNGAGNPAMENRPTFAPVAVTDEDGCAGPGSPQGATWGHTGGERPGDEFNRRGDVRAVLVEHGWVYVSGDDNERWRRPGKTQGWSATLKDRVLYVFSSNATPFEPDRAYSPFSVYALLACGGDFEQAARRLKKQGFGSDCPANISAGVDISGILGQGDSGREKPAPVIRKLSRLIENFEGLNPPVIHGLLREGETMNVIASPKMGKSWLVSGLAIAIASGLDWLGHTVEQGRVLHIDNELHANTSAYRYQVVSEAMKLPHRCYSDNIDLVSLRGQLRDLYGMGELFAQVEAGAYRLVILDAFYRTLPRDTDENDNGAIANLYNQIDQYASTIQCAFVLIHHTSKGNQAGKSVTDVGAGAGSQSRAADTHLVLRPHEQKGCVVLDSAVRSWAPLEPQALRWEWPLFTPADDVDPTALLGAAKAAPKAREVTLEDFVEECVASQDPCSKRAVVYQAGQRFDMAERRATELLELALEEQLVARIRAGSAMQYVEKRGGLSGDNALLVAAILTHERDADVSEVAEKAGVSERYVRQIRGTVRGFTGDVAMEEA